MKRSKILVGLIVCILALLGLTAVGCGGDKSTGKKPTKPTTQSEWGVYYYDYNGSEYLLQLADGNKVTVIMGNIVVNGTYARKGSDISLKHNAEGVGSMSATIKADNSVVTLTYNNVPMSFLRRVVYNVTFNSAMGSEVTAVEVLNGKSLSKPSDPVRAGYTFLGWYKDSEYKTPFIFESDIITANTTLYAQWGKSVLGENVYTVSFDVGDYEGAVNPQPKQTVGGKVYGLQTPTREGYAFVGWWYSVTNQADELTYRVDEDTVFNENTTLYAVWQGAREGNKLPSPAVSIVGNRISWDNVSNALRYSVTVEGRLENSDLQFERISREVAENYIDVDLSLAGEYTVTVIAVSGQGSSYNSEPTVRTCKYNPLARVSLFNVVSDTVLWNSVGNAEKYILNIDCGNEMHEHSEFDNGKSTYFSLANCEMQRGGIKITVTAVAAGYSSSVSEQFVYSKDLDAVPTPLYNEETQTVSWQVVPNATNYEISLVCDTLEHSHSRLDLGLNTSYCIKECAVPEGGLIVSVTPRSKGYNSPDPTTLRITAEQKSAPATPRDMRIVETTLSWSPVEADKYVVRIGDKEIETTSNTIDLSKQEVNWAKGSDYKIYVRAVKGEKASAWSDAVDARYYAMYSTLTYNRNTVSWRHVIGATGYEVRVNEGVVTTITNGVNFAKVKLTKAGDNKIEVRYLATTEDGNTEVSAWAPLDVRAYTLTYDTRGGSAAAGVSLTQYYAVGDELSLPTGNDIVRDGYTLGDMYTTPGGAEGNSARFTDTIYTALGDTVLYVNWVPKTYKITLNYNNGGTGVVEAFVTFGKPFRLPMPDTVTDGTTVFGGWCANTIGTAAAYTDEKGNGLGVWNVAGDTEVYAAWWSVFMFEKTKGGSAGFYYMVKANPKAIREVPAATVPATYKMDGDTVAYPVTQLAKDAFDSCQGIQEINLPSTIDTIQTRMFEGKSTLRAINVYQVSGGCDAYFSDNGVLYYNNATAGTVDLWAMPRAKTGVYTLNNRATTIPTRAFYYSALDELRIPATVTFISKEAFYYNKIPTITFLSPAAGEQTTALRLESGAFDSATVTTKIVLPAREIVVWNTKDNAAITNPDFNTDVFLYCSALTTIEVDPNNAYFQSIDGLLCSKGANATLLYCPKDRAGVFTVPAGIVKIGRRAFSNCRKITKVIIPNWVNEIEEEAFTGYKIRLEGATIDTVIWGCTDLLNVTFKSGEGVAADLVIGKNAFGSKTETTSYFCSKLNTITFEKDSGVAEIGDYAFARCPITKIILPASLSEVKEGAFYGCDKLETVEYAPNGKDISIGDLAFANCTSFTTVKLPANITSFNDGVFAGCDNLSNIEVDSQNKVLTSVDGVLFTKDKTEILFYPFGKEGNYQIPSTVTKISGGAFSGKSNITEINIGKNVTEIGAGAFRHCVNLEKVIFEDGGTEELKIGESAFNYCQSLITFRLPDRVKVIPARMLFLSYHLSDIYVPAGVTDIGDYAFYAVGSFSTVAAIEKMVIPASVNTIGLAAFANTKITEIEFEDKESGDLTLETVKDGFKSNTGVSAWLDTYLPMEFAAGESNLFSSNSSLTKVTLPNGLKTLPAGMFKSCSKLTEVTIPGTVTEMGYVFMNCSKLEKVTFAERDNGEDGKPLPLVMMDGTVGNNGVSDGSRVEYYYGVFAGCRSLKYITLPEGLTRIPDYCFFNCDSLESIHIPASVQNGEYTVGTTQLTAIGKSAFASGNIGTASSPSTPTMKLSSVTFEEGGTGDFSLGEDSFKGNARLTSITLPARLADVHVTANGKDWVVSGVRVGYQSNTSSYNTSYPSFGNTITVINVEEGGKYYSSDDGILYNADKTELVYVPAARTKDIEVPATVNLVRNFAFYMNKGVKKVTFLERTSSDAATQAEGDDADEPATPQGLVIGDDAMANSAGAFAYSKVEEIHFPKHLQKITAYAFYSCTDLVTLDFAEGTDQFTEIEHDAFNAPNTTIRALNTVILPDSVTTIGERAFRTNSKLATFTVSENSKLTSIGMEAFYGTAITEFYVPAAQSFELGTGVFSNCSKLTTVHLPNTVSSFDGLFTGSYALSTLDIYTVEGATGSLQSDNGVIYVDDGKTLSYYPIGKTDKKYVIPVGVTKIAAGAFMNNGYLEEIEIPNTVELILDKAFFMMPSLKKVVFESDTVNHYVQLTEAEKESYTGDRYIKIVNGDEVEYAKAPDGAQEVYKLLPKNALKVGVTVNATTGAVTNSTGSTSTGVFSYCQSLEVVNFPTRLEHLSGYAFYFCVKLHTVTFDANCRLGIMQKCVFSNTSLQYGGTREDIENNSQNPFALPAQMTEFAAASSTEDENRNPFGKVTKLVIPAGVTKVGNYAFYNSEYLQEVEFTGTSATQLSTVGTYMFKQCPKLTTVIIPNKITTLSSYMFQDCTSLTTVLYEKPTAGQTVTGVKIPSTVTTIDSSAFNGCKALTKVILPESGLTKINGSAFFNCTNLAKITYDETNTEYDLYLPSSATTLAASAFAGTPITTAYIPKISSLNLIFGSSQTSTTGTAVVCNNLKKVVFAPECTFATLPANMFLQMPALEEVVLPTSTNFKTIGSAAFGYSGLKRITIPASVTTINKGAFANCPYLESVTFAQGANKLLLQAGSQVTNTVNADGDYIMNSNYQNYGVFAYSGYKNGRAAAKAKAEAANATQADKDAYANNFKIDMSGRMIETVVTEKVWETIDGVRQQVTYTYNYGVSPFTFYKLSDLDVVFGATAELLGDAAFQGANIESITIPATINTINKGAFSDSKIKTVKFAASENPLTFVAGTNATIATSYTITCGAFTGASGLISVDMSERKITAIPEYTFYNCPNLEEIKWSVATAATETEPMTTHTATIADRAFEYSFNAVALDIPRGVTSIGQWAFGYSSLASVKLPNTLTELGYAAFYEVGELERVEFEQGSKITAFTLDSRNLAWTFGYCTDLKTVVLPDSLVTIGANAFYKTGLTAITIPKSVVTIGNYAFGTNPDLTTVTFEKDAEGNCALTTLSEGAFNATGITLISIPKSVVALSDYTFGGSSSLETITFEKDEDGNCALTAIGKNVFVGTTLKAISIPKSVTSIGQYVFSNISSFTSIAFEKDEEGNCALATIGAGAFNNTGITSVVIPKSVTTLGINPFRYCDKLTSLTVEDGNDTYVSENNVVYNADKSILLIYAGGIEGAFAIPNDVVEIGDYAFAGSKWAGALNVSLAGFTVGESAFEACGITSVTLASGVTIGNWAFGDNPELVSVTVGENVVIGESAFENCAKLGSVTLGSGVTVGIRAFADDEALTAVTLPAGATVTIDAFTGSGVTFAEDMLKADTVLKYGELDAYIDGTLVFNDAATAAAALKANENLEYVALAEGVTTIGNNAFDGITNLKKIVLPSTLTTIGNYAFRNCTELAEVVFGKDEEGNTALNEIGIYCFQNTAITSIVIPKSVVKFRYYAFYQCAKLTRVEFEKDSAITVYYANGTSGIGSTSDARHFADCPLLETVILPDHSTNIPATMFENSGITHITIPATVTAIWRYAFRNCTNLETVTFAKNSEGKTAITTINDSAFEKSGLTGISVPATVTTFATKVFQNCASLTTVTFEKDENGETAFKTFGTYSFEGTALTSISIPRLVTAIPINCFNGVSTLSEVTFEKDADGNCALTSIAKLAFAGTSITEISIPYTVTEIGGEATTTFASRKDPAGAFYNCASLASVTFEKNEEGVSKLAKIDSYAFTGTAITSISLPASLTYVYWDAFNGCNELTSVTWDINDAGNSAAANLYNAFMNCPKLKNFILGNAVKPQNDAFRDWGSDMTIYVVDLPGPSSAWTSASRWLLKCEAKWVWYWSPEKGFLNAEGKFENEVNNP
ncbi:MAG: leucine-rich repeat protein [Clostridiales bacterium]|nr:leucine-rich repeat protein [Clostridiales bacterium]